MSSSGISAEFETKIVALLRRQFSDFHELTELVRLTGGANQETYRLAFSTSQGQRVLALRRAAGGHLQQTSEENIGLHNEARLMRLAIEHKIPAPQVIYQLSSDDELGAGFIMTWLDGETRGARITRHENFASLRKSLAYDCGKVLAKIHALDIFEHALDDVLPERTPEVLVQNTWARYKALKTPQPMLDYTASWLLENLPQSSRRALVHSDFRNGNIMVDEDSIVAVLDWEIAHIGDPYRDLGWISVGSWRFGGHSPVGGFGSREDLFRGYEEQSGVAVDRAQVKFWEVFGSFWWGVGCLLMAQQYRDGRDQSAERTAIGRRSSECQIDCVNLIIPGSVQAISVEGVVSDQLPNTSELLESAVSFLRNEVMLETTGRVNYLTRVAANSLEIVAREQRLAPALQVHELSRLQNLFDEKEDLTSLRWRLVNALRNKNLDLSDPVLQQHLRQTVYENLAIDQPTYPGFKTASRKNLPFP